MQWIIRDIPLGVNIQKARMEQNLTQEQLIAQMQLHGSTMTRSTLANIEAGTRNIRAGDLKLMKKLLNVDYEEFFKD
jgi:transcriptional regulator with XRE-family HTH domain